MYVGRHALFTLVACGGKVRPRPWEAGWYQNQREISDPYLAVSLDLHLSPITDFDWVFLYFEAIDLSTSYKYNGIG